MRRSSPSLLPSNTAPPAYILLAIPFFMIAAVLMELTAMAARLVDAVQHWIGHWRGGLLIAEVVATYIFSGISGSKAADMAPSAP